MQKHAMQGVYEGQIPGEPSSSMPAASFMKTGSGSGGPPVQPEYPSAYNPDKTH